MYIKWSDNILVSTMIAICAPVRSKKQGAW